MVARFTADKPGQISFTCTMDRPEYYRTYSENDQLIMSGTLIDGKGGEGMQYMVRLKALNKNGQLYYMNEKLIIENADEVTLFLTASTNYKMNYPIFKGLDYKTISNQSIEKASGKTFRKLRDAHVKEYQQYFNRLRLNLTHEDIIPIPTNERIKRFKKNQTDLHLIELIFQFRRYLLISSSRPGTMPANLQGIWAHKINTAWNSDYHTDVNVQMNYWPSEVTNLSEMHLPLFDLIESLV